MPKFFDDLKGKAQSAINSTPLAAYVPGHEQNSGAQPASSQGSQGGGRSHALGALQHQFRTLQVQYGSGASKDLRQLQLVITGQKGVVLDLEKQAQDAKAVSKEFYIWGQAEDSDVKDVSDRLAYLTYVQGSLAATLAASLDATRAPLKALRDAESHMQPKRNIRTNYELQISRLKNEGKPGTEQKLKELETLLAKAEKEDESQEKEIELLKRKAIVESETQKWQALREYGEKLVILSQACAPLVNVLPSVPPTNAHPYGGAASTAATRATLQKALDNYKPGNITLPAPSGGDHETRSFGETHASELSRISSVADNHRGASPSSRPQSPPEHGLPPQPTAVAPVTIPSPKRAASPPFASPGPVNPHELNNAPAPIPSSSPVPTPVSPEPLSAASSGSVPPTAAPTVAETGMPVTAGRAGPGPASGSLAGGRRGSQGSSTIGNPAGPGYGEPAPSYGGVDIPKYGLSDAHTPARYESGEDEKKRLEREERERVLRGNVPPSSFHAPSSVATTSTANESAEEEKKRLEREERERVLRAASSGGGNTSPPGPEGGDNGDVGDGSVPPPYVEPR